MVGLEHATESLLAFDSVSDGIRIIDWLIQFMFQSPMVPFGVVMFNVFTHGVLQ